MITFPKERDPAQIEIGARKKRGQIFHGVNAEFCKLAFPFLADSFDAR